MKIYNHGSIGKTQIIELIVNMKYFDQVSEKSFVLLNDVFFFVERWVRMYKFIILQTAT